MHKTLQKDFNPRPDRSVVGTLVFKAEGLRVFAGTKTSGEIVLVNRASAHGIVGGTDFVD